MRRGAEASAIDEALATAEGIKLIALFGSIKSVKVRRRVVDLVRSLAADEG